MEVLLLLFEGGEKDKEYSKYLKYLEYWNTLINMSEGRKKKMKKKLYVFLIVLLSVTLFAGCSSQETSSKSNGDTIKVGLNYELSGNVAGYGQQLTDGVELAMEEINTEGGALGKEIELVKGDNKSDAAETASVATRLVTRDNVVAMLGPATSGNTKGATPPAMQNKVPLISASATADDVTVDSNGNVREYIFKTCFNDSDQGVALAEFASGDLAVKKAAILIDNTSDYSKGLAKAFKETFSKAGGSIAVEEAYQSKETDFKSVLTNIKGTDAQVLYVPGYYEEVGLIIKQARELGLDIPVLGADGFEDPKLAQIAGKDNFDNVYYTNHYSPKDDSPEVVAFQEAYGAKYDEEASAFNALGYDMAYLLVDAIERAEEADPEKVKDALAATKGFEGVTGVLTIDELHNPIKAITIVEVKNGEPAFLKKLEPEK